MAGVATRQRSALEGMEGGAPGAVPASVPAILSDPAFQALVRQRDRLGLLVVGLMMLIYFGFIALLAFAPGLMHARVSTVITTGFPLGLGVLVVTFVLVAVYARRSGQVFDRMTAEILARHGR